MPEVRPPGMLIDRQAGFYRRAPTTLEREILMSVTPAQHPDLALEAPDSMPAVPTVAGGLTSAEAAERPLARFGPNAVSERTQPLWPMPAHSFWGLGLRSAAAGGHPVMSRHHRQQRQLEEIPHA